MADTETQVPESVAEAQVPVAVGEAQVPEGAKAEGEQPRPEGQPRPEYAILPSQREEPESNFVALQFHTAGTPAPAQEQTAPAESSVPKPSLSELPVKQIQKLTASKTKVYAAMAVGVGLLVGLICAAFFIHPGQNGSNDMGAVTAGAYGLKGHLTLTWGDRLSYHLSVEPSEPGQYPAFLSAVNGSPRPLSVSILLKDPFGAVLCGNTILLKYDPRNAAPSVVSEPEPKNKRAAEDLATRNQIAQSLNLARLEAQELDREHGKDAFQNNVGADGKVASIIAQGVLPCSKKQFDSTASWIFTTNFPTVPPPVAATSAPPAANAHGDQTAATGPDSKTSDASKLSAEKKTRKEPAPLAPRIDIEGDDAIVWYDASAGIVETSAGKALQVDRTNAGINSLKGREFPVDIHYRCDQAGNCTFAGIGLGVQHARLRR